MLWVMFVDAQGRIGLVLPLLVVVDWMNSMIDVLLEPKSRKPLGGLPPMEYAIHMVSMCISGAIMVVAWQESLRTLNAPAHLGWRRLALPPWALMAGVQIICVSVGLLVFEGFRFAKSPGPGPQRPGSS